MPKRKLKKPVKQVQQIRPKNVTSIQTHKVISQYHILKKKLSSGPKTAEIEQKLMEQLQEYQKCSLIGQSSDRGGDSSRFLIKHLPKGTFKLLDVGALKNNYKKQSRWIDLTAIDLNSQCPDVQATDFMEFESECCYDVVCLSLVLNFVPQPDMRGDMLKKVSQHLVVGGRLFIVLPLACITNSRYLNSELFEQILHSLGYSLEVTHFSSKLAYYIFKRSGEAQNFNFKKTLQEDGKKKNNFCITLNH